jgi:hypothetical protein
MKILFSNPILFSLCLIPTILSLWVLQEKKQDLKIAHVKIEEVRKKAIEINRQNKINAAIFAQIKDSDPKYLQKELETLPLLESELRRLETILVHHKENAILHRRLDFLKSGQNHFSLNEAKRRMGEQFQEVDLSLTHPVELDDEDLQKMLTSLEGVPINNYPTKQGRPQILIREFDLTKETNNLGEEIFLVKCQLLKRESL